MDQPIAKKVHLQNRYLSISLVFYFAIYREADLQRTTPIDSAPNPIGGGSGNPSPCFTSPVKSTSHPHQHPQVGSSSNTAASGDIETAASLIGFSETATEHHCGVSSGGGQTGGGTEIVSSTSARQPSPYHGWFFCKHPEVDLPSPDYLFRLLLLNNGMFVCSDICI